MLVLVRFLKGLRLILSAIGVDDLAEFFFFKTWAFERSSDCAVEDFLGTLNALM